MFDTVFYNQQRSGYEELLSYGPSFYKNLLEMDVNYRFAGKTLDIGAEGLERLIQDQFIDTADEETISRWERWMNLPCRMRYKSMRRGGIVMAWQKTFLDKSRKWWLRKIVRAQYYASATGTWYEGRFTEKSLSGNTMTFKIETTDEAAMTITKVRLLDADGDVAYEGNRSIVKSATEGALIQIDVPMDEE